MTLRRVGDEIVDLVGEVQEADLVTHIIVFNDVAVLGIHQRAEHAVHVTQHLRHFQIGAGQIGDLEQRLLQPFSFFQRLDLPGLAATLQCQFHGLTGQPPPRCGRHGAFHRQLQACTVMFPAMGALADARRSERACRPVGRPPALTPPELRVVPADADQGRFRQKRMQRAHQRRAQHGLVWWLFRRFSMRGQMTISWRRRCVASPEPTSIARHPGGNGSP